MDVAVNANTSDNNDGRLHEQSTEDNRVSEPDDLIQKIDDTTLNAEEEKMTIFYLGKQGNAEGDFNNPGYVCLSADK